MFEYLMPVLVMRVVPAARCSTRRIAARCAGRSRTAASAACRGGSARARTTCATGTSPISTARSACPISRSSAGWGATSSSRRTRRRSRSMVDAASARSRTSRALEREGALGRVRLPRRARLHAPRRPASSSRVVAHVHGAPHRDEPRRARPTCSTRQTSGSALPRRSARARRPSCCCTSASRAASCFQPRRPRRRRASRSPEPEIERPAVREFDDAGHRRSRTSRCSAHLPYTIMISQLRRGLQPLRGHRRHPLARRRDARRHRPVLLREGRDDAAASGPRRTSRCARRPTAYRASFATDRVTFDRVDGDIETRTEIAVVPERRRRGAARHGDEQRQRRRARSSSRATARSCSRRPTPTARTRRSRTCSSRPSGTSGVRRSPPRGVRARRTSSRCGACTSWRGDGELRRAGHLRDRPRTLPRPRPLDARPRGARRERRRTAVGHRRRRARPDLRAPRARAARAGRERVGGVHHARRADARARVRAGRSLPTTRSAAQRALDLAWTTAQVELRELNITPGRRGGLPGARRRISSTPTARCARRRGGAAGQPRLAAAAVGASASPATGRSCSRRSIRWRGCRRCDSCSRRTTTGAAAA